jgi:hypothetical protein
MKTSSDLTSRGSPPATTRGWRALLSALCVLAALAAHGVAAAAAPAVSLLLEGPPAPLVPGSIVVYRVHVANPNATTATGALTVEANIPEHVKVWSATWSGYCDPVRCNNVGGGRYGNVVRWKIDDLAPKASMVLELSALVDNTAENPPPAAGTVITLDAIVKAGAVKAAGASTSASVQLQKPALDLAVSGATRAAPGGELEYTFRYGNASASASNAVLHVPVPAGTSVLAASKGAERKGNAIEWNLGSLPAGRSDWRQLRLQLDAKAKEGTLFVIEPELRSAGQKVARRATATTLVSADSPLALSYALAPDPAQPGATLVYKLEVTNQSPSSPTGEFTIHASIPSDVHVTSATAKGYCDPNRCMNTGGGRHGNNVLWKVASLAPGATVALQFTGNVEKPSDAAPPPNGTIVRSEATAFVFGGVRSNLSLAVGSAATAGNGRALEPLGAEPVAQAPPAAPPPSIAEPPPTIAAPAEEFVEEEEVAQPEPVAAAPDPKNDKKGKGTISVKAHGDVRWDKSRKVWSKYCAAKWEKREWDKRCMKRWRNHRDWAKRKAWWKERWKES